MEYISMYKRFFKDSKKIKEIYQKSYNSESAIHFDIKIHDFPAFVLVNPEMASYIEDIYSLNSQIIEKTKGNRDLPLIALNWLVNNSLIEEIKITNEIEGVSSTRKQLKELLLAEKPKQYLRLFGMVNKYSKLLNDGSISIKNVHELRVLYDEILLLDIKNEDINNLPDGKVFRKNPVEVVKGGQTIHHGVIPEDKIIEMMSSALEILNDEQINLLIRVAIFHYLFGYIHPFYEGNGRMSRFISSNYLCQKLDILSSLQLSMSCKQNQKLYYDSFVITNDPRNKGDLTYFVLSFLEILKISLSELLVKIKEKSEQYIHYQNCISVHFKDYKDQKFLDLLLQVSIFDSEGLTLKEIATISKLSTVTVNSYLKKETIQTIIYKDNTTKPYQYRLDLNKLDLTSKF